MTYQIKSNSFKSDLPLPPPRPISKHTLSSPTGWSHSLDTITQWFASEVLIYLESSVSHDLCIEMVFNLQLPLSL